MKQFKYQIHHYNKFKNYKKKIQNYNNEFIN